MIKIECFSYVVYRFIDTTRGFIRSNFYIFTTKGNNFSFTTFRSNFHFIRSVIIIVAISFFTVAFYFFNDNIYSFLNILNIIYCVFNFLNFIYWLLNFIYCFLNGFAFFNEFCNFRRIFSSLFKTFFYDCFSYFRFSSS